mmetsp:Transcript_59921/g.111032  ORF Transcript_59921/g.111032 Transcript_59921/m.111032 type:complete len:224 (-) Transcript_59921:274-945(-)
MLEVTDSDAVQRCQLPSAQAASGSHHQREDRHTQARTKSAPSPVEHPLCHAMRRCTPSQDAIASSQELAQPVQKEAGKERLDGQRLPLACYAGTGSTGGDSHEIVGATQNMAVLHSLDMQSAACGSTCTRHPAKCLWPARRAPRHPDLRCPRILRLHLLCSQEMRQPRSRKKVVYFQLAHERTLGTKMEISYLSLVCPRAATCHPVVHGLPKCLCHAEHSLLH